MKNLISIFVLPFLAICCSSFTKTAVNPEPITIVLRDTRLSATLGCAKNGSAWEISTGDAGAYLAFVANDLGKTGLGNFHNFTLEFAPDYSRGSLAGAGYDQNGAAEPIGIVYTLTSQAGGTYTMTAGEEHNCAGNPCSCCDFIRKDGSIIGCKCRGDNECHVEANSKCNHTVKTI